MMRKRQWDNFEGSLLGEYKALGLVAHEEVLLTWGLNSLSIF